MNKGNQEGLNKRSRHSLSIGFTQYGIVGFIILIPALLGAIIGGRIDPPETNTWTISLLAAGFVIGILSALLWIRKEIKHDRII
jgi:predicted F0F1-ATPase subunit